MIRINLLPVRTDQKKDRLRGQLAILVLSVILVVLGCAGVYGSLIVKIGAEKEAIARKSQEIDRLRKDIGEVGQVKKLQEELRGKLAVLEQLKAGKTGPVFLLDALSRALPDKLWLTSLKETAGSIAITGYSFNEETVAQFMRNLETSVFFQNIQLQVIEQSAVGGQPLHKFDVLCRYSPPPKSAAQ